MTAQAREIETLESQLAAAREEIQVLKVQLQTHPAIQLHDGLVEQNAAAKAEVESLNKLNKALAIGNMKHYRENERLREALEKVLRKSAINRDPHDDIQGIIGRLQNIAKVAQSALDGGKP